MSHMELQIYKGDGWIAETDDGDVVLYDWNAPDVDELRKQIGKKVFLGDIYGVLRSVKYVKGYFGRYSASGYLDATDWWYGKNKRQLEKELRNSYGSDDDGSDDE